MKTIIKILFPVLVITGLWGCNLDHFPEDAITQEQSLQSMKNVDFFRNGVYAVARGNFGSGRIISYEIMADYMNTAIGFSNTYGSFASWTFTDNEGDISGVWGGALNAVANINYFIDNIEDDKTSLWPTPPDDTEKATLKEVRAEAMLLRAMVEHQALVRYCKVYSQADPATDWGIPIVRIYDPLAVHVRSTLEDSYNAVLDDIAFAKEVLKEKTGSPNAYFLNIDCVYALEAQVMLQMGEYQKAAEAVEKIVESGKYTLIEDQGEFTRMWETDEGKELIFTFYASTTEGKSGGWDTFGQLNNGMYMANFIPSQGVMDLYANNDIRKGAYFKQRTAIFRNVAYPNVYMLNKYPGNSGLNATTQHEYAHKVKVFRLADMILIAAEAYAMLGNVTQANYMLNMLCESRIQNYSHTDLTGDALMEAIKTERLKEMIMEGTRISDLRRWEDGFTRKAPQIHPMGNITLAIHNGLTIQPDNYMFVWPVPRHETAANPTIQQNEGW